MTRAPEEAHSPPPADDEIDLSRAAHVVWQYRRSIALIALLGIVFGAGVSLLLTRFRSEGLFLTPGLSIQNYKSLEASFLSVPRMESFLEQSGFAASPAAPLLRRVVEVPGAFGRAVQPVFSFTQQDAKQFGVEGKESEILGLRLALEDRRKSKGAPVRLLAEYVRDTRIKVELEDHLIVACRENVLRERELGSERLQAAFELKQQQARARTLRDLMQRLPGAGSNESRQIMSVGKGGERYLSPETQLVATEVAIAEIELAEERRARELTAAGLRKEYYCRASAELQRQSMSGMAFLERLKAIESEVLGGHDLTNDVVELTSNTFGIQQSHWHNHYVAKMRFVTSPEDAQTRVRKPGLLTASALGLVLGGALAVLLAFARAWWRENQDTVTAEEPA